MITKIKKRDGRIVKFNPEKIENAIWAAVQAVGGKDRKRVKQLTNMVVKALEEATPAKTIPTVEEVQDLVEKVLIEEGHAQVAKAYILYRKQHKDIREVKGLLEDIGLVEHYLQQTDWRVRENANMSYSLQGLNVHIVDRVISHYWLNKIYPEEVKNAHQSGDFHIHDLGTLGCYCVGWDLKDLLTVGFKGVRGKIESKPARHFRVALMQVVNFMYTLQGEAAGAIAFSNFDTLLAPFIRYDKLNFKQVKQAMQEFLFNINVPTRVGFQTPFTNVTLDLQAPKYMAEEPVIIGGKPQEETYGEFQKEQDMFNRAFAEVIFEGDAKGRPFTFPIPTYNLTKDFDWEDGPLEPVWKMTAKYGIPYFANFINADMKPEDARSMCCRLRLDKRELKKRGGGLFGSNPLTGSIGVMTINLPRIGYLAKNKKDYFERLEDLMDLARKALQVKRETLERLTEKGLYPYSKFYLRSIKKGFGEYWKNHFSTIGLLGMNESLLNFMDKTTADPAGIEFASEVLDFMRGKLADYQAADSDIYNLEATPAEGASYRLARLDKEKYPELKIYKEHPVPIKKEKSPYYTNSTHLPVGYTQDIFEALDLQDELQTKYTGGTVLHGFLGEKMPSIKSTKALIRKIAENYRLPYFTLTPTFSICPVHGYLTGEQKLCPRCLEHGKEQNTEIYSRVVGYLRPVEQWNDGKQAEFGDRKTYDKQLNS